MIKISLKWVSLLATVDSTHKEPLSFVQCDFVMGKILVYPHISIQVLSHCRILYNLLFLRWRVCVFQYDQV